MSFQGFIDQALIIAAALYLIFEPLDNEGVEKRESDRPIQTGQLFF